MARRVKPVAAVSLVVVIAVVALFVTGIFGDVETDVTLRDKDGCRVTGKETEVIVKAGKKIKWKIKNRCATKGTIVSVGNFRTTAAATATNCSAATQGGAVWPFENGEELSNRQNDNKITLELKDREDFPNPPPEYYFDICYGPNGGVIATDPRLVIEY